MNTPSALFDDLRDAAANGATQAGKACVRVPVRNQIEMQLISLEQMLPDDRRARVVWRFVLSLDLTPLIQVSDSQAGRSATPPSVLVALWLLATLDGIGKARQLDRRCKTDLLYRWLLGGITVNAHLLRDCPGVSSRC